MCSSILSIEGILIVGICMNLQGEGETRYDIIKELKSGINGTELAKVHDVGKVVIADIGKKK